MSPETIFKKTPITPVCDDFDNANAPLCLSFYLSEIFFLFSHGFLMPKCIRISKSSPLSPFVNKAKAVHEHVLEDLHIPESPNGLYFKIVFCQVKLPGIKYAAYIDLQIFLIT